MDAKVLLDMTLMLHQERVPTLTPTTPMLLDMIQMILLVARALLDMTLMIPILQEKPLDTTPVVEKVHLDMTQAIPMLQGTTQMIPITHSEKVQTLTPTTPMLLDMIQMILTDTKVLLDTTLMLHQEKVPTLTPTTPMLLDTTLMIPMLQQDVVQNSIPKTPMLLDTILMILMVAKVHLGLIPMILTAEKVQNTIQMILTQETAPNTTLMILMLPIARDLVIPMEQDQEKDQAMIPIQLVAKVQTIMITNAVVMVKISMMKSLELVAKIVRTLDNEKEAVEVLVVSEVAMKIQVATTQLVSLEPETEVEKG